MVERVPGIAAFARGAAIGAAVIATAVPAAAGERTVEVTSPHFVVYSDAGEAAARDLAVRAERVRATFARVWPWARVDTGAPVFILAAGGERAACPCCRSGTKNVDNSPGWYDAWSGAPLLPRANGPQGRRRARRLLAPWRLRPRRRRAELHAVAPVAFGRRQPALRADAAEGGRDGRVRASAAVAEVGQGNGSHPGRELARHEELRGPEARPERVIRDVLLGPRAVVGDRPDPGGKPRRRAVPEARR